jgi:hypothetical protein
MAETKFDLKNIEKLIDERKQEQKKEREKLGESTNVQMAHDNDLHELINALNTSDRNSRVVNKMKVVEHRSKNVDVVGGQTINKNSEPLDENTIKHITAQKPKTPKNPPAPTQNFSNNMQNDLSSKERDDMAFSQFTNTGSGDLRKLYNNTGILNEYNTGMKTNNPNYAMPHGGINPQIIQEQIGQHTVNFINEHFVKLADQALKNHIIEQYAQERVKKVLKEDLKDVIKELVVETIREIQQKNKKKSAN